MIRLFLPLAILACAPTDKETPTDAPVTDPDVTDPGADSDTPPPDADDDGITAADGDCDDGDPAVYPGAPERCDGKSNGCGAASEDGLVSIGPTNFASLTDALAAAAPGDTIAVCAGTWPVAATITADLTIQGHGDPTAVVLTSAGGRLFDVHGAAFALRGITAEGGAAENGGIISIQGGSLTVADAWLIGGLANGELVPPSYPHVPPTTGLGGAVWADDAVVTLTQTNVVGGQAVWGGGLALTGASTLVMSTSVLSGSAASGGGAGIYLDTEAGNATIAGSFYDLTTAGSGAGILSWNTPLTVDGTDFRGGRAAEEGGAIVTANTTLVVRDSEFENNTASSGGAIVVVGDGATGSTRATLEAVTMTGNTADTGGAVRSSRVPVVIDRGSFIGNSADEGGAVFVSSAAVDVRGATFLNNAATGGNGGAIVLRDPTAVATVTLESSRFEDNTASMAGGAAYLEATGFNGTGVEFLRNTAALNGGGLWIRGDVDLTGARFEANHSGLSGGGMYAGGVRLDLQAAEFSDNTAGNTGGGLLADGETCSLLTLAFNGNTAGASGGGIGIACAGEGADLQFSGNRSEQNGGGAFLSGDFTLDGANFDQNVAAAAGGGAEISGAVTITDAVAVANSATNGGAWFVHDDEAAVTCTDCAFLANNAAESGGAMYVTDEASLTLTSGTFESGTARSGADVALDDGILTASATRFAGGRAEEGSALDARGESHVTLADVEVTDGFASAGSAVRTRDDGSFTATRTHVHGNAVNAIADVTLSAGTIAALSEFSIEAEQVGSRGAGAAALMITAWPFRGAPQTWESVSFTLIGDTEGITATGVHLASAAEMTLDIGTLTTTGADTMATLSVLVDLHAATLGGDTPRLVRWIELDSLSPINDGDRCSGGTCGTPE